MEKYRYYAQALIHLDRLRHNLKLIRSGLKKGVRILVPVKCDAYGFGLVPVSRFLEKEGVDYLGVAYPFEGIRLRKSGVKKPILLFGEIIHPEDYRNIIRYHLTPTLFTEDSLRKLRLEAERQKRTVPVHIKIDTGMGRNGIAPEQAVSFIRKISLIPRFFIEGIYTHLSAAEEKKRFFTLSQLGIFLNIIGQLRRQGVIPPLIHALNSAGIMNYPGFSFSMVRPGIMFYGYYPDNRIRKDFPLKPAMTLRSRICHVRQPAKGTPVSYGHTYRTRQGERIATVSAGYGDGVSRLLSNSHSVLVHDRLCPVRGRICMDQFMIGLSGVKNCSHGDWAVIFGKDKKREIRLEKIAQGLGTIPYEIICGMGERVERVYQD